LYFKFYIHNQSNPSLFYPALTLSLFFTIYVIYCFHLNLSFTTFTLLLSFTTLLYSLSTITFHAKSYLLPFFSIHLHQALCGVAWELIAREQIPLLGINRLIFIWDHIEARLAKTYCG